MRTGGSGKPCQARAEKLAPDVARGQRAICGTAQKHPDAVCVRRREDRADDIFYSTWRAHQKQSPARDVEVIEGGTRDDDRAAACSIQADDTSDKRLVGGKEGALHEPGSDNSTGNRIAPTEGRAAAGRTEDFGRCPEAGSRAGARRANPEAAVAIRRTCRFQVWWATQRARRAASAVRGAVWRSKLLRLFVSTTPPHERPRARTARTDENKLNLEVDASPSSCRLRAASARQARCESNDAARRADDASQAPDNTLGAEMAQALRDSPLRIEHRQPH